MSVATCPACKKLIDTSEPHARLAALDEKGEPLRGTGNRILWDSYHMECGVAAATKPAREGEPIQAMLLPW